MARRASASRATTPRSPRGRRPTPAPADPQALPVLQPHAAGLDIGATQIFAALPPGAAPEPVRAFGTFTRDLEALAAWLRQHHITTVAMESTGVYWIPVFQLLERQGLEVCLVNAQHVKHPRGRKTDVSDCQWLQQLHAAGLLQPSFRPPDAICAVRAVLRCRDDLVTQSASQIQLMQKALTQMNLQLHHVLSDLVGVSGLRIVDALLAGERDPERLAALREPGVKAEAATVVAALQGDWRPEHLFALRIARETYTYFQQQLQVCDREIERLLAGLASQADPRDVPPGPRATSRSRRKNQIQLPQADLRTELFRILGTDVTQTPGLGPATVAHLVAEVGVDLAGAFGTPGRFTSWAGLCPDPAKTGGRTIRQRRRGVCHRVGQLFREAAQALHASQTPLGQFYRRIQARQGGKAAVAATAHKLARIYYHLVTRQEAYDAGVFAAAEERDRQRRLRNLRKTARQLGMQLVPAAEVH